jgi:hypothetical protein
VIEGDNDSALEEADVRFISMVKTAESGPPSPELMGAIGKLAQELGQSGVLMEMGGLLPSARGARMRLSRGGIRVTDGPFTESKELVGGYAIFSVASKAEAIELGRRFLQVHADVLGPDYAIELEIRELFDSPAAGCSAMSATGT